MKRTTISKKVLFVLFISVLIALTFSTLAFADEDPNKDGDRYIYSLKDFWENYKAEDIGYHVTDHMEKIYLIDSEEPLEIQIEKEVNDGPLVDHFIGLAVNWVYSTYDPTVIYYEEFIMPDYEVTEEGGTLRFTFSKDSLKSLVDFQRYEFLFRFDDGEAYSLVWATGPEHKLVYNEEGHVFVEPLQLEPDPPIFGESIVTGETDVDSETEILLSDEAPSDEVAEINNIIVPIILGCVIITAFAMFMAYRFKSKEK